VKNCIFHKCILVVAAFCLFFNSIGFQHISIEPRNFSKLQPSEISNGEEIKSSVLVSFIDSEERNFEFENEKDAEEGGANDHLIASLEQQLIAVYINDFNLNSIVNSTMLVEFMLLNSNIQINYSIIQELTFTTSQNDGIRE
jgi:hypothetical protein